MAEKQSPDKSNDTGQENKDHKPTAGSVKEQGFEQTTWEEHANHNADSTKAERDNTSKTLPRTATRDKQ